MNRTFPAPRSASVTVAALLAGLFLAGASFAFPPPGSVGVVKAEAKADKADAEGVQTVTVTLTIDKGWHLYANPVGNDDYVDNQTVVTTGDKTKLEVVSVDYPAGKPVADAVVGAYKVYEGKVSIKARVRRVKDATGPVELSVAVQACNEKTCLPPGKLKVAVP